MPSRDVKANESDHQREDQATGMSDTFYEILSLSQGHLRPGELQTPCETHDLR